MPPSYKDFFEQITEHSVLPYQQRLADNTSLTKLLVVPTGLGKTDAALLPWLYAKATFSPSPTRLIFVLPRQNLTVQTARVAAKHVAAAGLPIRVLDLLGGSKSNRENLRPDEPAIIVATQDLYFSRALNRGYARRPPRWPIDFALYNQDCVIVLDEIQLMDEALATSTQLAAFRNQFGCFGAVSCIWMSATVNKSWLNTVDFSEPVTPLTLDASDLQHEVASSRYHAAKSLAPAPEQCRDPGGCAAFVLQQHRQATRSIVIANTVARAREIFIEIRKRFAGVHLLHSRFRPTERREAAAALDANLPEGQIIVATQVLEAGIDVSSRLLVSDLAPWASMVQRFGRLNRYGGEVDPQAFWIESPVDAKQKPSPGPYPQPELSVAATRLRSLTSAAPADLPLEDGPAPYQYVLRRADLLDLFDTTPDLGGNELDISRFIRATDDKDVYLAWRDWPGDGVPPPDTAELEDDELCPVPIGELREFAKKHSVYTLNFATEQWTEVGPRDPLRPGLLLLTRTLEGGYTPAEGWSPESKARVAPIDPAEPAQPDSDTTDVPSFPKYRQSLQTHTARVVEELEAILRSIPVDPEYAAALRTAALKHDWGKTHEVFQETMHRNQPGPEFLAKQCGNRRHKRPHFRHELASALAMLQSGDSDLAVYLVAAHHGKVRLGIRSMPREREENGCRVARGVREGDVLPACEVVAGVALPAATLTLAPMEFGAENGSWTERTIKLRDRLGPFRLAYLEMLLRAADEAASGNPLREFDQCQ